MRVRVEMRLPVGLVERLNARAEELRRTRTSVVEEALEGLLGSGRGEVVAPSATMARVDAVLKETPLRPEDAHGDGEALSPVLPKVARRKWAS